MRYRPGGILLERHPELCGSCGSWQWHRWEPCPCSKSLEGDMRLTENSLNQFKAFLLTLVQKIVGPNLAAWFAAILDDIKLPEAGPTLVIAGFQRRVGDAPPEVKLYILEAVKAAISRVQRPLIRLALNTLVSQVLPGLIDQVYDAIVGGSTGALAASASFPLAAGVHLDDLVACDAMFAPAV